MQAHCMKVNCTHFTQTSFKQEINNLFENYTLPLFIELCTAFNIFLKPKKLYNKLLVPYLKKNINH